MYERKVYFISVTGDRLRSVFKKNLLLVLFKKQQELMVYKEIHLGKYFNKYFLEHREVIKLSVKTFLQDKAKLYFRCSV